MEGKLSPKQFLKARRPERFSDSTHEEVTELDRSLLEYHLNSLTSRSQEAEFERFARAVIKKVVCPNLLPQTGPTGGGDSKVDSETYPVADSLAFTWYVGIGREASAEHWAFAFSAKEKWDEKLRSDVAKIAKTNRDYMKAFFATNQYVRDKRRGELEDELREKHEIDVRIFDRTWILDVVFDNALQDVAIDELGVSAQIRKEVIKGPKDLHREAELNELESRIQKSASDETVSFVTVDDCCQAAILSRELERPMLETTGRLARADEMALKFGTHHQRVRAAYDRAWTAFFWFEDFEQFAKQYAVVKERAKDSTNIYDLELLTNLWVLLHGHSRQFTDVDAHTALIVEKLTAFAEVDDRPSASLQAESLLLRIGLLLALSRNEDVRELVSEFSDVISRSEGLIGFAFRTLADTLLALGETPPGIPHFDELVAQLADVVSRREGDIAGARILLTRSEQQLDADQPTEALSTLGRVLHKLAKEESRELFIRALYDCACAYERLGLPWAARGTLLCAASVSMSEFWRYEDVTPFQAMCVGRLKWVELQLGRVPQVLNWHELDAILRRILHAQGYDSEQLAAGSMEFDAVFGVLLLLSDFLHINHVVRLPDRLSSLNLNLANSALLHVLGHEPAVPSAVDPDDDGIDRDAFFVKWRDQPARDDLPERPDFCNQQTICFESRVIGCQISLATPNDGPYVELGESILAAIEGVLATGLARRLFALQPQFEITVRRSDFCEHPFEFAVQEVDGHHQMEVKCRDFNPDNVTPEDQAHLKKRVFDLVVHVLAHIVIPDEDRIETILQEDGGLARSIDFTASFLTVGNILGADRKRYLSEWVDGVGHEYTIKRQTAWDANTPRTQRARENVDSRAGSSPPSLEDRIRQLETAKHSQVRIVSLIRGPLWDRAKWQGMGMAPLPNSPPILSLIFGERQPTQQIFELWRKELGEVDEDESLRISIVRGISQSNPHHYRVMVGPNIERADFDGDVACLMMQRINTMEPATGENLENFLASFRKYGAYFLAPAVLSKNAPYPEDIGDYFILKRELTVRDAWQVGVHELEQAAILPGDKPIIPITATDPLAEVLDLRGDAQHSANNRKQGDPSSRSKSADQKRKKEKRKRKQARKSRKRK